MNNHKIPNKCPTKLFIGGLHGDEGNYTLYIGDGALIASISPVLRNKFTQNDFCMTIEIPKWKVDQSKGRVLEILKMGLDSESRREMTKKLEEKYPEQMKIARYLSEKYNFILF